jgi:hypothetical protein
VNWVFPAFLAASALHMLEEYFLPGGFLDFMRRVNPRLARLITARMAVAINALQLLLCAIGIVVGTDLLVLSMSVAGLLAINGVVHIGASLRARRYAPGLVTGLLLYLPLSGYAYVGFVAGGRMDAGTVVATVALGLLYQAVPALYLALASRIAMKPA